MSAQESPLSGEQEPTCRHGFTPEVGCWREECWPVVGYPTEAGSTDEQAGEQDALASALRSLSDDSELLYNVARRAIEDELVEWRDARRSMLRNNGFVIRESDGSDSSVIRFGPEVGVRIALRALADHLSTPPGSPRPGDPS